MIRAKTCLLLGIICSILVVFFVGVFYDRHTEGSFFLKHRPTLQYHFCPPEYYLSELSPAERKRERDSFQEFVVDRDVLKTSNELPTASAFLVQAALTFLIVGGFSLIEKKDVRYWQLLIHFLLCILPTAFGLLATGIMDSPLFLVIITITWPPLIAIFLIIVKKIKRPQWL